MYQPRMAATLQVPDLWGWWRAPRWEANAFGAALTEVWENMPCMADVNRQLDEWGIRGTGLDDRAACQRYARFEGV